MKQLYLIFMVCLYTIKVNTQEFEFAGSTPFNIQIRAEGDSRGALKYFFTDQDADGDLDLILFGLDDPDTLAPTIVSSLKYFFELQENIGNIHNPQFGSREKLYEDFDFPGGFGFALPCIGELNNDQKFDVLIAVEVDENYLQHPLVYLQNSENIFDKHRCEEWELDPLTPNSLFFPELVDLDMDGDQDLLLSGYYGESYIGEGNTNTILYAKNIGTPTNPDFLGWFENPYGLELDTIPMLFRGGDLDLDNDMDLLAMSLTGDEEVNFHYFRNEPGMDGKPHFGEPVDLPVGFPVSQHEGDRYIFPNIVDIDGDRDLDIFFFHQEETDDTTIVTLDLYENKLCTRYEVVIEETICEGESIEGYTASGNYTDSFIDSNGCDSVRILNLNVLAQIQSTLSESICEGDEFEGYSQSGTYTDIFQTANGCDSTRILELTVLPGYESEIQMDLCDGERITIGGEEITVSGYYTFNLETAQGCDSTVHADLSFHVINNTINLDGDLLIAEVGVGTSYQWFDCNSGVDIPGANSEIFQPLTSGLYGVHIMDEFGCIADSECISVTITKTLETEFSKHIKLLPNPADDYIHFVNKSDYTINRIRIYDQFGTLVLMQNYEREIAIKMLPSGLYFVSVELHSFKYPLIKKLMVLR